ncbi:hypothetical protein [Paenibacillus sp. S150]|uniref:hypothetical protein n=1 Tax=Paenibacillus sp. S150 TaxID=2749826 RepID=UPI001C56020B|nr:hypothetical protein [Paenibacillus sp. S150]MBW4083507.1 hypothetical protein [Paenibacillus sp. S150]
MTRMRMDSEDKSSPFCINSFDHSIKTVLSYLKQETYVWESSLEDVLKAVQRELAVQRFMLTQRADIRQ